MKLKPKNIVLHDVWVWLARTKTWLYSEVIGIGDLWEPWVVANRTENLNEFPFENIFSVRDKYGYMCWFLDRVLVRIGLCRTSPIEKKFIMQLKPDIIHSHFGTTGWKNLKLAKSIGAKHVVSFYGTDVSRIPKRDIWKRRYRELFYDIDAVLCEGPFMASAINKLGCPKSKIHIYHLGVNLDAIQFRDPSWYFGKPLRILMAASFVEKKGLTYGLEAVALLKRKRPDVKLQISIVGDADQSMDSQRIKKEIQQIIIKEGLSNVVKMKGFCSHKELLLLASEHDIFLSPSVLANDGDSEGGAPVSIIEMAAAGLMIVSTRHCDIPHVLGEKNRNLLVAERDTNALVNVLDWLVKNNEHWNEIARENRLRVESDFNVNDQGPALARIYEIINETGVVGQHGQVSR